ncbi:MAG TPA: hypothetical protein VK644_12475 [Chitinophagaceae bacterium]|nr:hypothetical protein [Chitinophagaceae bacterium]
MASKQYISIIRLFHHCDIATGDDFNLARVKKNLQVEFNIARDGFIEVDGYTYTRHDVMEEIERPDFAQRLVFHKQIWEKPQLLQLLEKNTADLISIHPDFSFFSNNQKFDDFFSPYFAVPVNYISRTLLTAKKMKEVGDLLKYDEFVQPSEREEAFRPIGQFLEENLRTLRNVNQENYKTMRPAIVHWIDQDWHKFFNELPGEFYHTKSEIARFLINIGVHVQKSHRRDCKKISAQLVNLHDMPEHLSHIIVSNHEIYNRVGGGFFNWGKGWWIVIWVLFMLLKNVDGCGGSSSNAVNFRPAEFKLILSDSLINRAITDSTFRSEDELRAKFDSSLLKKAEPMR